MYCKLFIKSHDYTQNSGSLCSEIKNCKIFLGLFDQNSIFIEFNFSHFSFPLPIPSVFKSSTVVIHIPWTMTKSKILYTEWVYDHHSLVTNRTVFIGCSKFKTLKFGVYLYIRNVKNEIYIINLIRNWTR